MVQLIQKVPSSDRSDRASTRRSDLGSRGSFSALSLEDPYTHSLFSLLLPSMQWTHVDAKGMEVAVARLLMCLAPTIEAFNQRGVVHNDLKGLNIMFADKEGLTDLLDASKPLPRMAIVDWGMARKFKYGCTSGGTLGYMTLESLGSYCCTMEADWCVGGKADRPFWARGLLRAWNR